MYVGIRTDSPLAELYIYDGLTLRATTTWQADRELARGLLAHLEKFLREHDLTFQDITGVFAYQGPGSFTGLRIGITVINTIAYARTIPVIGATGDAWRDEAVARLERGESDEVILPLYGADARITSPRK